jgi:gamma-glutamylcyclotransferase (GGCT)/AIG2-like uncharacterized protein YtfP
MPRKRAKLNSRRVPRSYYQDEDFQEYLPAFVYGTLRVGFGNYRSLLQGNVDQIVPGSVRGIIHAVMGNRGFPCLFDEEGTVKGELMYIKRDRYIEVMFDLDMLEGNGFMYQRRKTTVTTENGESVTAWAYYWMGSKRQIGLFIRSGDWKAHVIAQQG